MKYNKVAGLNIVGIALCNLEVDGVNFLHKKLDLLFALFSDLIDPTI